MQSYASEKVPMWALEMCLPLGRVFLSSSQAQEVDGEEKLVVFSALVADMKAAPRELS